MSSFACSLVSLTAFSCMWPIRKCREVLRKKSHLGMAGKNQGRVYGKHIAYYIHTSSLSKQILNFSVVLCMCDVPCHTCNTETFKNLHANLLRISFHACSHVYHKFSCQYKGKGIDTAFASRKVQDIFRTILHV